MSQPPNSSYSFCLDLNRWKQQIDTSIFESGLELYDQQKVEKSILNVQGEGRWRVMGEVFTNRLFKTEVALSTTQSGAITQFSSTCSCEGIGCPHAIASVLRAAYQSGGVRLVTVGPPSTPVTALGNTTARHERDQRHFSHWLQHLPLAPSHTQAHSTEAERLIYVLSSGIEDPHKLGLRLYTQNALLKKGWSKPRAALRTLPRADSSIYASLDVAEQEIIEVLRAIQGNYYFYGEMWLPIKGPLMARLLERLAKIGRLFWAGWTSQCLPLRWTTPLPLKFSWNQTSDSDLAEPIWSLQTQIPNDSALLLFHTHAPVLYVNPVDASLGLAQCDGISQEQLTHLLKMPSILESSLKHFERSFIQKLGPRFPLPALHGEDHEHIIQGVLPRRKLSFQLRSLEDRKTHPKEPLFATLKFVYEDVEDFWGEEASNPIKLNNTLLYRAEHEEKLACEALVGLGIALDADHTGTGYNHPKAPWMDWIVDDFASFRQAGFEVIAPDEVHNLIHVVDQLDVALTTTDSNSQESGAAWFDLSLGIQIDGQRINLLPSLPSFLNTWAEAPIDPKTDKKAMPPYLYQHQANGQILRIPSDVLMPWVDALLDLLESRSKDFAHKDSLHLSRLEAMRLSASIGHGLEWSGAAGLQRLLEQLKNHGKLPEVEIPESLKATATLRPYQVIGVQWLQFLREHGFSGLLADDMGLGKTLQTLAHVLIEKEAGRLTSPALIIAPVSLMGNWQREAARFTPSLKTLVLHGKDRKSLVDQIKTSDIVIAPYSLLHRDREQWLLHEWHLVALDEAQNIKNASTYAAQVVSELKARHRLCLSGTPMENHLGELWSLFHFLMPGFLGSQTRFKTLFRNPIEKENDRDRLDQLRRRVSPFMLRRTKDIVAAELPEKIETISRVELLGEQADLYETIRLATEKTIREALNAKGLAKSQIMILDALLKLRQVCCDPRLVSIEKAKGITQSAKLEQLMELLPEMIEEGRKILVFSQFTSMLSLIEEALKERQLSWVKLTGQSQKRDQIIDHFTSGKVPLFLISLKAGGVGLNLPQADTVIHYDPWWNPAVENQATDRAHRIGQTQHVWVYKLVAQGTIEERILALQSRKAELAQGIYQGAEQRQEALFTETDLEELLRPLE